MENSDQIGLIGLGLMGTALAERFTQAGWSILGWDISSERCTALAKLAKVSIADSSSEVLAQCDFVVLSLPSHEVVETVLLSVVALRPNHVIIDTSTGDPQAAVRFASQLAASRAEYLDATVSGSSEQVRSGTAVMLIGASPTAWLQSQRILQAISNRLFHIGPPGSGAQMKLVSNLVLGLNRAALAEGLAYAQALGLPAEKTLHLLRESMAYSRIMDTKGEKMIHGDFTPQAKLSQHAKDVGLILASAQRCGIKLPLSEAHQSLLDKTMALGRGDQDNSAIICAYD